MEVIAQQQQWCVSLVAASPRPLQLNITVQPSCVKEIDWQTASNQQLCSHANHMHASCDGPEEQPAKH